MYCWLNGELLPMEKASVPVTDRGLLYGDSLFETMRVFNSTVVLFDAHLDRLERGAAGFGFSVPVSRPQLAEACRNVITANRLDRGVLRVMLTRGSGTRGPNIAGAHSPILLLTASSMPPDLEDRRRSGYVVVISEWRKPPPSVLPNMVKTGNYLNSILAFQSAASCGADEALLLDVHGYVAECSHSNIFFVFDDHLVTPSLDGGALAGVLRREVIELAKGLGIHFAEGIVDVKELSKANEVFLTNSVIGVMPVAKIDKLIYPVDGPLTKHIAQNLVEVEVCAV